MIDVHETSRCINDAKQEDSRGINLVIPITVSIFSFGLLHCDYSTVNSTAARWLAADVVKRKDTPSDFVDGLGEGNQLARKLRLEERGDDLFDELVNRRLINAKIVTNGGVRASHREPSESKGETLPCRLGGRAAAVALRRYVIWDAGEEE